jgi:hypothetical protein
MAARVAQQLRILLQIHGFVLASARALSLSLRAFLPYMGSRALHGAPWAFRFLINKQPGR